MYSKTILLAAASLAVAGTANATPAIAHHPMMAREQVSATLRLHRYHLISAPYFFRGHYVARSVNPFGRVVLVEIDPRTGAFIREII